MNLGSIAVMITAKSRPGYLGSTLASWRAARSTGGIHSFTLALGYDEKVFADQVRLATTANADGFPVRICPDSTSARRSNGMGRAIAECVNHIFADPAVEFVVCGEEDVVVSDDVIELMAWSAERFADNRQVLLVNGHDEGGQGWNTPGMGALNGNADQWAARLNQSFNPWCWGTWRDRWTDVLLPAWDFEVNSGGVMDSGHDWHVATRIIPHGNYLCVTPDASRSQNIGQYGGWAADPAKFEATLSASFREHREPGEYVLRAAAAAGTPSPHT